MAMLFAVTQAAASVSCAVFMCLLVAIDAALMLVRRQSNRVRDAKFNEKMDELKSRLNEI
jgi:hypothetical protein